MIRIFFVALILLSVIAGRIAVRWVSAYGKTELKKKRLKWIGWSIWACLNLPTLYFIAMGLGTRGAMASPWQLFFLYPYFAWMVTSLALNIVLAAKTLVSAPYTITRWWKNKYRQPKAINTDRRDFLAKAATAIPAAMLLTSGYGIVRAQRDFDWFTPELKLKDWPRELEGFRIMQISDLHVGNFMPGTKLAEYVEQINRQPCDMLMITGDIINNNMAWFPDCMEGLSKLKLPKYGAYVCIGNHDYYSGGPEEVLDGMRRLGMTVVRDNNVLVPVGNSRITVAGIDYPMRNQRNRAGRRLGPHVDLALQGRDPDAPVILLAHHPHAFDHAAEQGVQLTVAGHTHGGQFAFTPPGGETVSLGDLMFKYVAGPYEKNGSHLYVNRGIGNWFPMRLGAPPEVTLITVG
jgi:predicted MPP superfamily phosphohydrolase